MKKEINRELVFIGLMISTFLTAIEGTIVSTAMPKIASDLQGIELMNWVFSIYLLLSAITVPIFGKLSDLFGRKVIFVWGTLIFLLGSTLCGFSQNMGQLILFRAIQGIGAGAINPVTMTIIGDIYPPAQRAKMLGFIGTVWSVSGIIGPLVGGFFVDHLSWHWIFFINVPFGLISLIMILSYLRERIEKSKKSIDYWGALTFSVGMVAFLYALQRAGDEQNWTSPPVFLLFGVFVIFISLFIWIETKVNEPMLPLNLFRIKIINVANAIGFLTFWVLIGLSAYIPMWIQGVLGRGATASGFMLAPMSVTWTVGSFLCGRLMVKRSPRTIALLGLSCLFISTVWLALLGGTSSAHYFYAISAIQGIGFGLVTTLCTVSVQSSVDWSLRGVATASNIFFRSLGQTMGIAVLGTIFNARVSALLREKEGADVHIDQLNQLINSEQVGHMSPETVSLLRTVLVEGIHFLFIILIAIVLTAFVLHLLLPKKAGGEKVGSAS